MSGVLFFINASAATMTNRALAPLPLDMQAVLTDPFGRRVDLTERVLAPEQLRAGQKATVELTVRNLTTQAVHEVVVADEPSAPLSYVDGSTTVNGHRIADVAGRSPLAQGMARTGLNLGTLVAASTWTITYEARANADVTVKNLRLEGAVSSREDVIRVRANTPRPPTLGQLAERLRRIPGIAWADELRMIDIGPQAVTSGGVPLDGRVRIVGFDPDYAKHYPSIDIIRGSFRSNGVVVSSETARVLRLTIGKAVNISIPGLSAPMSLPVTGIADLSNAQQLFMSRKASKLEDFLYVPFTVIAPLSLFTENIVPAFQRASAIPGAGIKSTPLSEVDIRVERTTLNSSPASALTQTTVIAGWIRDHSTEGLLLIDNISNALTVAADDAMAGRRMFLFLGLPGVLLAIALVVFNANLQAESQRRDHATMRLHGAERSMLIRIAALRTLLFAGCGALIGVGLGLGATALILGWAAIYDTPRRLTANSSITAISANVIIVVVVLTRKQWQTSAREIGSERRDLSDPIRPTWHRRCFDLYLVLIAAIAVSAEALASAPENGSVSKGRAASLPLRLLLVPMAVWLGGILLFGRLVYALLAHYAQPVGRSFGTLIRGSLVRNVYRRSWPMVSAEIAIGLVVSFSTELVVFNSTYNRTKSADARFAVGSDLRITPLTDDANTSTASLETELKSAGVSALTGVTFSLENSVLIGPYDQARTDLAAIDPASFEVTAALDESTFDVSKAQAMRLLARPDAVLISVTRADDLSINVGDEVSVLLARGSKHQKLKTFDVVGLFEAFPGFPQGLDAVVNRSTYRSATALDSVDFFLARTDGTPAGTVAVASRITRTVGGRRALRVVTSIGYLNKDQSSLTAVNVRGLLEMGIGFACAIGISAILMVVFVQFLQRREYVALRAFGMSSSSLASLILGESLFIIFHALAGGLAIGLVMARVFVIVLRPIFLVTPQFDVPIRHLAGLGLALVLSTVAFALIATAQVTRQHAVAILRET